MKKCLPLFLTLGDSTDCDREVCSIVSGEDEDLKFLDAGDGESTHHRAHEPEIQKASEVAIEGIKEPTALISRLTAVCCLFTTIYLYIYISIYNIYII